MLEQLSWAPCLKTYLPVCWWVFAVAQGHSVWVKSSKRAKFVLRVMWMCKLSQSGQSAYFSTKSNSRPIRASWTISVFAHNSFNVFSASASSLFGTSRWFCMENGSCVVALRCINMHKLQQNFLSLPSLLWSWPILWCGCPEQRSWRASELSKSQHWHMSRLSKTMFHSPGEGTSAILSWRLPHPSSIHILMLLGFVFSLRYPFFDLFLGHGKSAAI